MSEALVGVVMGSDSDWPVMSECCALLEELGLPWEAAVTSAHRTPEETMEYALGAADGGLRVLIAGASGAAHLAGALAANTHLPVIGVPLDPQATGGLDALLSTVQMPAGVPVATMGVGKAGARNAAILAAQILALSDDAIRERLLAYRQRLRSATAEKAKQVQESAAAIRRETKET
jgi:phosphoribosylaminoimidazole carboxylase PurE protein